MQQDVNLPVLTITFLQISHKPHHRPRTRLYLRKANEPPIPTIYCAHGNTVNFSRTSRIHFCQNAIQTSGIEQLQNLPFLLGHRDAYLIHECLSRPTHHPKRQLDRFTHFHTTTQQSPNWLQWDVPHLSPKVLLPLQRSPPHLIHPSLDRPHSPPHTASRSNQHTFQTDTQTDRWDRQQIYSNNAYTLLTESNVLII